MDEWQALARRGKIGVVEGNGRPRKTTIPEPPAPLPAPAPDPVPPLPRDMEETGLSESYVTDLILKTLHVRGSQMGQEICEEIRLPYPGVIQDILTFLKEDRCCEILGGQGLTELTWTFRLTDRGEELARTALRRDSYVGPAPVSLDSYVEWAGRQRAIWTDLTEADIRRAVSHLVLNDRVLFDVGPAFTSGKPLLIYGHAGNGKTVLSESLASCLSDTIFIPYALEAGGQTIRLYDAAQHLVAPEPEGSGGAARRRDARWLRVRRPFIVVGGELTFEQLGLTFDPVIRCYMAPIQMKANGGILLIDDFGRQQVSPRDLLNRWIIPMEKQVDYHTLATGTQIRVPFNVMLIFSTNLEPKELVDEAFLRRIRYKMMIPDPTEEQFREIFLRVCDARGLDFNDDSLDYLVDRHYRDAERPFRASHPRDLLEHLIDIATFHDMEPDVTPELLDRACGSYFV